MNTISNIIQILSEEEKREFILQLKKKNRRTDTKNLSLFKLIEAEKTKDLDKILYGEGKKNAYHALCKRLQDSLIDFIASKSFAQETSEELEILKLLLASRIFFEHRQYKIAFKTLTKAENQALQLDLFSILNEIYHTKIQYAHLSTSIVLDDIIQASGKNMQLFQQEYQLNLAYASIKEQLKGGIKKSINEIIIDTFSDFNIAIDSALTYKSLYQLMNITATAATWQNDYHSISPFMMEIFSVIEQKKEIAEKHLYYHIEVLHLMAVTQFRLKDFKASKDFALRMELAMKKSGGVYYKRFQEKHLLIQSLNDNYTGHPESAIATLRSFPGDSLDVHLSLITCLFQQSQFAAAYMAFRDFYHSDTWYEKKAGWIWVLKKSMIEILLLVELDKLDLVLHRWHAFKRKFSPRLKKIGEERVLRFMNLIIYYYEYPEAVTSEAFKERVENSFEWIGPEREDIFVMSFYAWLKAKMEHRDLYETTLSLVH